jgi:phosphate transport system ATP-binding protein
MNDLIPSFRLSGSVLFEDHEIYKNGMEVSQVRRRVGMVFQKPCMFPTSILENLLFGIKRLERKGKRELLETAEETLREVSLWDHVKDRLHKPAGTLSQGQQQRLAIGRALTMDPSVLLLDEPTASLDIHSAEAIEKLVKGLKDKMTVVLVTHKLEQVERTGDDFIVIDNGKIREAGSTRELIKETNKEKKVGIPHWRRFTEINLLGMIVDQRGIIGKEVP